MKFPRYQNQLDLVEIFRITLKVRIYSEKSDHATTFESTE